MHLREEIKRIQYQMKSAIQNHQMIVFKLKDRPVSTELRVQMNNVQRHIVNLGERQKKLLQELRKNIEANGGSIKQERFVFSSLSSHKPSPLAMRALHMNIKKESIKKEDYDQDIKSSVAKCLKNVETHIKVSHPPKKKAKPTSNTQKNGHLVASAPSPSRKESTPSSTPSSSPTHGHATSRNLKQRSVKQENSGPPSSASDESQDAYANLPLDPEVRAKLQFMTTLGLITREVLAELQSRRTERKRRSTANPQFLYGNHLDLAMKRKKTNYLLSGNPIATENSLSISLQDEQNKPSNSLCSVCSSTKGSVTSCASCQKTFHLQCGFESAKSNTETSPKCKTCAKKNDLPITVEAETEKEQTQPIPVPDADESGDQ